MKTTNTLCLLLLFYTTTLLSMEPQCTPEVIAAYTPIPTQKIRNIDDVPPFCTEMAMKLYMQPIKIGVEVNTYRPPFEKRYVQYKYVPFSAWSDAHIVGLMSQAAKVIHQTAWDITSVYHGGRYNKYIEFRSDTKPRITIAQQGKLYEKVIFRIKDGWRFVGRDEFTEPWRRIGDPNEHFERDSLSWYRFIKDSPLKFEFQQYGTPPLTSEIRLISFLCSTLDVRREHVECNDGDVEGKDYLWIKKDAFEEVQEKLRFHLPSKEELLEEELNRVVPLLEP